MAGVFHSACSCPRRARAHAVRKDAVPRRHRRARDGAISVAAMRPIRAMLLLCLYRIASGRTSALQYRTGPGCFLTWRSYRETNPRPHRARRPCRRRRVRLMRTLSRGSMLCRDHGVERIRRKRRSLMLRRNIWRLNKKERWMGNQCAVLLARRRCNIHPWRRRILFRVGLSS